MKHTSAIAPLTKHMLPERQTKNTIAHASSNGEGRIIPRCSGFVLQGPGQVHMFFWERNWGKMTAKSYRQRILPDALGFIGSLPTNNGLAILMDDNAPVHTAAPAREYLKSNGVVPMAWPPFSPDLNPIENVWGLMITYIQENHGGSIGTRQRTRAQVRPIVLEAWRECTRSERLLPILQVMHGKCEAVIQAQGGSIPY
ncbi:hypothetical protein K3495_g4537 [Podosphaera aphanis]|nr:hypothetical protein K3495_g4537 [Podosphaera aphanis]